MYSETCFSEKEVAMFQALGYEDAVIEHFGQGNPIDLYRIASMDAFINNLDFPAVDSLRRCMQAITNVSMYRRTPAFEGMINLYE